MNHCDNDEGDPSTDVNCFEEFARKHFMGEPGGSLTGQQKAQDRVNNA